MSAIPPRSGYKQTSGERAKNVPTDPYRLSAFEIFTEGVVLRQRGERWGAAQVKAAIERSG